MKSKQKIITYAAFLRGINVGGKGLVSMKALKESFENAGFKNVQTYINSGNIIFQSTEKNAEKLESEIEIMLTKRHALTSKVAIRNTAQMKKLATYLDEIWKGKEKLRNSVMFLRKPIDSKKILSQMKYDSSIEEVTYKPGVVLWSVPFENLRKSRMLKINAMPIYKEMTVRNLNTTRKVFEIMKKSV